MDLLKKELLMFHKYWMSSFKDPLDWFTSKAASRDYFLYKKYSIIHKKVSTLTLKEIYEFLSVNKNDNRLFISILVILDQVSRQLYRDSCKAFKNDSKTVRIGRKFATIVDVTKPSEVGFYSFCFWLMCFEHSEHIKEHKYVREKLLARIKNTSCTYEKRILQRSMLYYLDEHTKVLQEFGYYPKRKIACGKRLTVRDKEYIENENKGLPF